MPLDQERKLSNGRGNKVVYKEVSHWRSAVVTAGMTRPDASVWGKLMPEALTAPLSTH